MNIELNNELIERCNNQSMYNRGTHIKESAESDYKKFIDTFSSRTLNPQQLEIVKKRTEQFKELITNVYNEYLSISANFVPVNVAGQQNIILIGLKKLLIEWIKTWKK